MSAKTLFTPFWDQYTMTYTEGYSLIQVKLLAIWGSILMIVAIGIYIGLWVQHKPSLKVQDITYEAVSNQEKPISEGTQIKTQIKVQEVVADVFFWLAIITYQACFPILNGFDFIPLGPSIIIIFLFSAFAWANQFYRIAFLYHLSFSEVIKKIITKLKSSPGFLALAIFILSFKIFCAIFFPFLLDKSCMCFYSTEYGIEVVLGVNYSSQMTRGYWIKEDICQSGKVCHFYATLPSDTDTSVFFNIHAGREMEKMVIEMESGSNSLFYQCQKQSFPERVESRGQRSFFICLVTGLVPDALYTVKAKTLATDKTSLFTSKYRTLPDATSGLSAPLNIYFGGDCSSNTNGQNIVSLASTADPHIILIGGDVAYDNANVHCYYQWDLFLKGFEKEFQEIGRIVPFIFSVGNHDVGYGAMGTNNITMSEHSAPFYFQLFPQAFADQEKKTGIQKIEDRRTFNFHFIRNLIVIGLDSGYVHRYDQYQQVWLKDVLKTYSSTYYPFAHYHNPIYPTCYVQTILMDTNSTLYAGQKYWVPIFDEYKFVGIFENHVHQYKRTFPLIANKLAAKQQLINIGFSEDEGTVYFGDGAMGPQDTCEGSEQTILNMFKGLFDAYEVGDNATHYWVMTINDDAQNTLSFTAKSEEGVKMNNSDYKIDLSKRQLYVARRLDL